MSIMALISVAAILVLIAVVVAVTVSSNGKDR